MSTVCLLCRSFTIIHHVLCEIKTFSWLDFSTNSIWFGTDDSLAFPLSLSQFNNSVSKAERGCKVAPYDAPVQRSVRVFQICRETAVTCCIIQSSEYTTFRVSLLVTLHIFLSCDFQFKQLTYIQIWTTCSVLWLATVVADFSPYLAFNPVWDRSSTSFKSQIFEKFDAIDWKSYLIWPLEVHVCWRGFCGSSVLD